MTQVCERMVVRKVATLKVKNLVMGQKLRYLFGMLSLLGVLPRGLEQIPEPCGTEGYQRSQSGIPWLLLPGLPNFRSKACQSFFCLEQMGTTTRHLIVFYKSRNIKDVFGINRKKSKVH